MVSLAYLLGLAVLKRGSPDSAFHQLLHHYAPFNLYVASTLYDHQTKQPDYISGG